MKQVFWNRLSVSEQGEVLRRPAQVRDAGIRASVLRIVEEVKSYGDVAIRNFTEKFDRVRIEHLRVTEEEFEEGVKLVSQDVRDAMEIASRNIAKFHRAQKPRVVKVTTQSGVDCVLYTRPIQRVGFYIPGGTAVLPSTLLMLGIPSKIAGCRKRVVCTPPNKEGKISPLILLAARLCGVRDVFKVGGVQAIAAMAYGTVSVQKVDKIFGPGNAYVTEAKLLVAQDPEGATIDMPAGPSEVMVVADENANSKFVASDLLSQAEHDAFSQVILVTTDERISRKVRQEMAKQLNNLPRRKIAEAALRNAYAIIVGSVPQAVAVANAYAPEHLILQVEKAEKFVDQVQHAGSVFLGPWSPESVGDYASGTNHVLPTYGHVRTMGGITLNSFLKAMAVQKLSRAGLKKISKTVEKLAEVEGLEAHRRAVGIRLGKK